MAKGADPATKLLWIDLEMTGLEVEKEVIIEVAALVTDLHLVELASYHTVVKQPQHYLDNMDEWNQLHHGDSGLTAKVPKGKDPKLTEKELIALVQHHFKKEPAIIAGNTIYQDRTFIKKYWPDFDKVLHYRMLDVTSWKIIFKNRFNIEPDKQQNHRALDDIRESIDELKHYLNYIRV